MKAFVFSMLAVTTVALAIPTSWAEHGSNGGSRSQLPQGLDLHGSSAEGLHVEFTPGGHVCVTGEITLGDDPVQVAPAVADYEVKPGAKGPKVCFRCPLVIDPEQSPKLAPPKSISLNFYGSLADMENQDNKPDDDRGGTLYVGSVGTSVRI